MRVDKAGLVIIDDHAVRAMPPWILEQAGVGVVQARPGRKRIQRSRASQANRAYIPSLPSMLIEDLSLSWQGLRSAVGSAGLITLPHGVTTTPRVKPLPSLNASWP